MAWLIAKRRRDVSRSRAGALLASKGSVLFAATLFSMAASFQASATTSASADLNVTAVISAGCAVSSTRLPLAGGALTVTKVSTALNGTGAVTTACTPGTNAVFTLDRVGAANTDTSSVGAIVAGPISVVYPLSQSSGRRAFVWGTGAMGPAGGGGTTNWMPAQGQESAMPSLPAGSHSDTVLATLTF
jgi:spore coat protein U-like protein